ncbi:AraC family transcriptional regulator [Aliikangiella marina]|nr:AraC family transcriptional regulator [Aliikangiella marina]
MTNKEKQHILLDNPDALSSVLSKLELTAEVYANGDYCGAWGIDTSGSRKIPFHLIGRGRAWLHLPNDQVTPLSTGDLVIFPRDIEHVISDSEAPPAPTIINQGANTSEGDSTNVVCGFFEFTNKAAWPLLDSLPELVHLDLAQQANNSAIRLLIDLMIRELQNKQQGYYAVINQLSYLLFIEIIRQQIKQGHIESGLLVAMFDNKLSNALSLIHNHPKQQWTLESLAKASAMGRSSFASRFHTLIGMPAMQYLSHWRMQQAMQLLSNGDQSMYDIAEQVGYHSEVAFRKAFKKITGMTPGAVRRKNKLF